MLAGLLAGGMMAAPLNAAAPALLAAPAKPSAPAMPAAPAPVPSQQPASLSGQPGTPPSLELSGLSASFRLPEYDGEAWVPLGPELAEWLGGGATIVVRLPFVEVSRGAGKVRLALGILSAADADGTPVWLPNPPVLRRGTVVVSPRTFAAVAKALGFTTAWVSPGNVLRLTDTAVSAGGGMTGGLAAGTTAPADARASVPVPLAPPATGEALVPAARMGKPANGATNGGPPRRPAPLRIVLDPGHGGTDCGARGRGGTQEKDITLDLARRLGDFLKRQGFEVAFTRDRDEYVDLKDRVRFAERAAADLLVSIHVNASRNRSAHGVETYRYGRKVEGAAAAALVSRENADSDYVDILGSLAQDGFQEQSVRVAGNIEKEMVARLRTMGRARQKIMEAPFYILAKAGRPAVLLEVGFISNATEEKLLRDSAYRQKLVESIGSGLLKGTSRWRN